MSFNNLSKAGVGMYGTLLTSLMLMFDIEMTESQAEEIVITIASLVSIGMWAYGQYMRRDLEYGVKRKDATM